MTESDWLTSTDPQAMLDNLRTDTGGAPTYISTLSDRKLRLFSLACERHFNVNERDPERARLILAKCAAGECWVDGEATFAEVARARQPNLTDAEAANATWIPPLEDAKRWVSLPRTPGAAEFMCGLLREIVGNPYRPFTIRRAWECKVCGARPDSEGVVSHGRGCYTQSEDGGGEEWIDPAELLPFWLTPLVRSLAEAAYSERVDVKCGRCGGAGRYQPRDGNGDNIDCHACHGTGTFTTGALDPDRLAVLADACEEAGCTEEVILRHLRGQEFCLHPNVKEYRSTASCEFCGGRRWRPLRGPHVRGCWAIDLLTGRE